jgi:hypothetical protein
MSGKKAIGVPARPPMRNHRKNNKWTSRNFSEELRENKIARISTCDN